MSDSRLPKYLYHGTSAQHLDDILAHGIKPRSSSSGNWSENPSIEQAVYLTWAHHLRYATTAVGDTNHQGLIIRIDTSHLDTGFIIPDEDAISQSYQLSGFGDQMSQSMAKMTAVARMCDEAVWGSSLETIGNVGYIGVIPVDAIVDFFLLDWSALPKWWAFIADTSASILSTITMGREYSQRTEYLLGIRDELEDIYAIVRKGHSSMLPPFDPTPERGGVTRYTPDTYEHATKE